MEEQKGTRMIVFCVFISPSLFSVPAGWVLKAEQGGLRNLGRRIWGALLGAAGRWRQGWRMFPFCAGAVALEAAPVIFHDFRGVSYL